MLPPPPPPTAPPPFVCNVGLAAYSIVAAAATAKVLAVARTPATCSVRPPSLAVNPSWRAPALFVPAGCQLCNEEYTIADMAVLPWFQMLRTPKGYLHPTGVGAKDFLSVAQFVWTKTAACGCCAAVLLRASLCCLARGDSAKIGACSGAVRVCLYQPLPARPTPARSLCTDLPSNELCQTPRATHPRWNAALLCRASPSPRGCVTCRAAGTPTPHGGPTS